MKKLLATAAALAGLVFAGAASAATVDIKLVSSGANSWNLTVDNHGSTALGAINMFVAGLNTFTPNAGNAAISGPDSTLALDPLGDGVNNFLVINNLPGQAIVGAGATGVLLGTLTGPGPASGQGADFIGQDTLFDTAGNPLAVDFSVTPEPSAILLLGLGLGGFALARRRAA
jgi:PEP-CTERM motif-containing protein